MLMKELLDLAQSIDPDRAELLSARYAIWGAAHGQAAALATLVGAAFPAMSPMADHRPELFSELVREGWRAPRSRSYLVAKLFAAVGNLENEADVAAGLRRVVQYEKLRIA